MRWWTFLWWIWLACVGGSATFACATVFAKPAPPDNPLAHTFSAQMLTLLNHCLERTEKAYQDDPAFEFNLQEDCSTLARLLEREDFSAYLQQPLDNNLTVDQLMDLQSIGSTMAARHRAAYGFDFNALPDILKNTLVPEPEKHLSWWKRFLNWLAEIFESGESRQPQWLKDWLSNLSIPAWFVQAFYTGAVIILAILLLSIVVVEVRAAGVSNWFKRRSRQLGLRDTQSGETPDVTLTWDAIFQLPDKERLLTSYHKLLHVLARNKLIPGDFSLTNYELQCCLEKSLGGEQPVFRQLVHSVEAALYGDKPMDHAAAERITRSTAQYADSLKGR